MSDKGAANIVLSMSLLPVAGLPGVLRWQPMAAEQRAEADATAEHAAAVQATIAAMMPRVFEAQPPPDQRGVAQVEAEL